MTGEELPELVHDPAGTLLACFHGSSMVVATLAGAMWGDWVLVRGERRQLVRAIKLGPS